MPKQKRKLNTRAVLRTYWSFTRKHPWLFGLAIGGAVVAQIAFISSTVYIGALFDALVQGAPYERLFSILKIFAALSVLAWLGLRIEMWLGYRLISRVGAELTNYAYDNLMRHSYQFFTNAFAGALTRRVGRFSNAYENLHYASITILLQGFVYILGVIAVLLSLNWTLGMLVAGWVVIFVALQWWMSRWQQPLRLKRAEEDSNMTAALADSISNQNTVALFSANAYESAIVGRAVEAFRQAQQKSWDFNAIVFGIQGFLSIVLNVGMLTLAVIYFKQGTLSLGDIALIQGFVMGIFESVWNLGRQFHHIYTSLADASEMVETIEMPFGVSDKKGAKKLKVGEGEVWFDDVTFGFNDGTSVLEEFNLKIAGGERVALVGPSGAGKTTVTKLLLRLYDVQKGAIRIDGADISKVSQDSLREAIGFVPQEPILFHRTLMENIRYGRRDATDEEVIEAAKQAHCHEFIEKLPQKYETFVGERGIKLSGGERQRVAIARAILKNAPILVLDEATSSLDSESEAYIQDALETLMEGKTVVVIAHRLSTIMKMDRIVVMEGGTIVAQGTHLELVNQSGLYQRLWSIQAGGFLGDGHKPKEASEALTEDAETAELADERDPQ